MHRKGFSLVQVILMLALTVGLGVVVAQLAKSISKNQKQSGVINEASNLQAQIRSALATAAALSKTKSANPTLNACLSPSGCTQTTFQPFELRDTGNAIIVPAVPNPTSWAKIRDGGGPCGSINDSDCQWNARALFKPVPCGVLPCTAPAIQMTVQLDWAPPTNYRGERVNLREVGITNQASKEQFVAVVSNMSCGANEYMYGIDQDGKPRCNPLF